MPGEHFGVAAARGDVSHAERQHSGADVRARERGLQHDALSKRDVMIIERDDEWETPEHLAHPRLVYPIEPGETDHLRGNSAGRQIVGRAAGVPEEDGSVADDRDAFPGRP